MTRLYPIAFLLVTFFPFFASAQDQADINTASIPISSRVTTASAGDIEGKATSAISNEAPKKTDPAKKTASGKSLKDVFSWSKTEDVSTGSISRTSLAKLKATNLLLVSFLRDSCLADSMLHPVWHGEFTAEKTGASVNFKYGIRCSFNQSALQSGKAQPIDTLSIMANDLSPLLGHITVYGQDYTTFVTIPTVRNECPYFEPAVAASTAPVSTTVPASAAIGGEAAIHTHMWLVTARPDEVPYTIVSRKSYLEQLLVTLKAGKEQMIVHIKEKTATRPLAEQEAVKQRELDELKATSSGAELQMRTRNYLEHYKSDEDYLKENIDKETTGISNTIDFIDGMLHRLSPATLTAPAIVSGTATEFEGFADGEAGSVMLVQPKPFSADPTSGPEVPRFFVISWSYDPLDRVAANVNQQLGKKLYTRILKDLLKK